MGMIKRLAIIAFAATMTLGAFAQQPAGTPAEKKECVKAAKKCDAAKPECAKADKKCDAAAKCEGEKKDCCKQNTAKCEGEKKECTKAAAKCEGEKKDCCKGQCGECCKDQCGACCKDDCGKCCKHDGAPLVSKVDKRKLSPKKREPRMANSKADASREIRLNADKPLLQDPGKDDSRAASAEARPQVIDYYATWCGPCKTLSPILEKIEKKYAGKVDFSRVDIDQNRDLVAKDKIAAVPTLLFIYKDGHTERIEGLPGRDVAVIESVLDAAVASLLE